MVIDNQAQSYGPGSKEDFDRLYRSTYQRIFATLVIILKSPAAAEDATRRLTCALSAPGAHGSRMPPPKRGSFGSL